MIFNLLTKAKEIFYKNNQNVEEALDEINNNLDRQNMYYNGIDLNTLIDTTNGYCNKCTNTPTNGNGFIEVIRRNDSTLIMQRYTKYNDNRVYTRTCNSGTWSNWVEHPISDNLSYKNIVDQITVEKGTITAYVENGIVTIRVDVKGWDGGFVAGVINNNMYIPRDTVGGVYISATSATDKDKFIAAYVNAAGKIYIWTTDAGIVYNESVSFVYPARYI